MSLRTNFFIILLVHYVIAQNNYKSSLTFVIDDTMSMRDDIEQVMQGANAIFDEVAKHESSQIDNFIFLTFNDYDLDYGIAPSPGIKVRANTKDPKVFKEALQQALKLHGNIDCAEYSMSGIKKGLEISLPGSYIYVFTDASAKDYTMFEEVKRLAQQKQSQIVFVLTGKCDPNDYWDPWPEKTYQIYYDVAEVASGEVFNIERDDVNKILEYVKISIQGRRRIIAQETLQPGKNEIEIRTDDKGNTVTVSLTSEDRFTSTLEITAVDGSKPLPEIVINKDKVKLYKVNLSAPGVQKLNMYVSTKVQALVTALSGVTFQHGFSSHKPLSINSTSTRPLPDTKSHLSIKLIEGDIELKSVRLLGMDKKVMTNQDYPLELINNNTHFYATEPFNPPETMFWIEIVGYDPKTKTNLMRMSLTPVEIQTLLPGERIVNKSPSIVIEGGAKIIAEFEKPLEVVCSVSGYPKPDIIWKNKDNGVILPGNISAYNLPYDYVNILTIDIVSQNSTYECRASNLYGSVAKEVAVETIPKRYFRMLESPQNKHIQIEYEKVGKITCMVEAYPPPEITWYKNGKPLLSGGNIKMSYDKSIITIKYVTPSDKGKYMCEARNADTRNLVYKYVTVIGVERPIIDKLTDQVFVKRDSSTFIECKILKGKPKPSVSWYYSKTIESEQEQYDEKELYEWKNKERILINNAGKYDAGIYQCQAINEISSDEHKIKLTVEYPPTILDDTKLKKAKAGSEISIGCNVDGGPSPNVTWYKDEVEIQNSDKFCIFRDYTLRLTVELPDSGLYTCKATNGLGTAIRTVKVEVNVPVSITKPNETSLAVQVGSLTTLLCEAKGFPKPKIEWLYDNFNRSKNSRKTIKSNGDGTLLLQRIQVDEEGYYTCVAHNSESFQYLTYDIYVFAPPTIENTYKIKHFTAVEGDLALRIKCKTTGNPKPTISWLKDDFNLALGTTYHFSDDSLIITNVPKDAQGVYACEASNYFGTAREIYEVTVEESPSKGFPKIMTTEEGRPVKINCNVPHNEIDQLRWYKNGELIQSGELTLTNPKMSDSGHYTCRVSNYLKSASGNIRLVIGQKPMFTTEEEETIELVEGAPVSLICYARGVPAPGVTWFYNGQRLGSKTFVYQLTAKSSPGQYKCEVSNTYGSINRTFNASPRDCYVKRDKLTKMQPLMVTSNLEWPFFETTKEYLLFPKGQELILYCPSTFQMFPKQYLEAFCDGGMTMLINGHKYNYTDIECKEEISHTVERTGEKCMAVEYGDTEIVKIGYDLNRDGFMVDDSRIDVYDICMDKTNNVPVYSFHFMLNALIDENNEDATWSDSNQYFLNFEQLYDCETQINTISSWLGKWFHRDDKCCFAKRQLVNPRDVFPGVAQRSTFSYLNVVPQWGTCNADNWEDIEQKVRDYARTALRQLMVWTGTAKKLRLLTSYRNKETGNFFTDRNQNRQQIPIFFWKVIQDSTSQSSLAIVQVNIPDLSLAEVNKYILCEDICHQIDWMNVNNNDWRNVDRGYVYCCSIEEFEKSFGLEIFEKDMARLLTMDAALSLPESSFVV